MYHIVTGWLAHAHEKVFHHELLLWAAIFDLFEDNVTVYFVFKLIRRVSMEFAIG